MGTRDVDVVSEIVVRDIPLSDRVLASKYAFLRWLASTLGVYSPRDGRDTVVYVLDAIFYFHFSKEVNPTSAEIFSYVQERCGKVKKETVRYHLRRLVQLGILRRRSGTYSLAKPDYYRSDDPAYFIHAFFDRISSVREKAVRAARFLPSFYQKSV